MSAVKSGYEEERVVVTPTDASDGGARIQTRAQAQLPRLGRRWPPKITIVGNAPVNKNQANKPIEQGAPYIRMVPQQKVGPGRRRTTQRRQGTAHLSLQTRTRCSTRQQQARAAKREQEEKHTKQQADGTNQASKEQKRTRSSTQRISSSSTSPTGQDQPQIKQQIRQLSEEMSPIPEFPTVWIDKWKNIPTIKSAVSQLVELYKMKRAIVKYRTSMRLHMKRLRSGYTQGRTQLDGIKDLLRLIPPLGVRDVISEVNTRSHSTYEIDQSNTNLITTDVHSLLLLYINKLCTAFKHRRATITKELDIAMLTATIEDCWEATVKRCAFPGRHSSTWSWYVMMQNILSNLANTGKDVIDRRTISGMLYKSSSSTTHVNLPEREGINIEDITQYTSSALTGIMMQYKNKERLEKSDDSAIALDLLRNIIRVGNRTIDWEEVKQRFIIPSVIQTSWAINPKYPSENDQHTHITGTQQQTKSQRSDNYDTEQPLDTKQFRHEHMHGMEGPIQEEEVDQDYTSVTPLPTDTTEDNQADVMQPKTTNKTVHIDKTEQIIEIIQGQQNIMMHMLQSSQSSSTEDKLKENQIVVETITKPVRKCTQYKDFKKQSLPMLQADVLKDPEQWFMDFERLMEEQNVHQGDYISCMYNCCQLPFKQNLMGRLNKDNIQRDYVQLRQFIATTYGPKFPLIFYLESLSQLPRNAISVTDQLSHIQGCCDKYERAWERYNPSKRRQLPEIDEDVCFNVLMRFMLPFAPAFVALLQRQYQVQNTTYIDIVQMINQELQSDPELIAYHNRLYGVNSIQTQKNTNKQEKQSKTLANKRKRLLWDNTNQDITTNIELDTEGKNKQYYSNNNEGRYNRPINLRPGTVNANRGYNKPYNTRQYNGHRQLPFHCQPFRPKSLFNRPYQSNHPYFQQTRPNNIPHNNYTPFSRNSYVNKQRYPNSITCFKCGRIGHTSKECRQRYLPIPGQQTISAVVGVNTTNTKHMNNKQTGVENPMC